MNQITHDPTDPVITTEPLFSPTEDTRVSIMSAVNLPARVALMTRAEEQYGVLVVIIMFNGRLTSAERVQALHRSESLPADLVEKVAQEVLERGAQAVSL